MRADTRAMLQLLLERGQSYGDIAAVLGSAEDDVRVQARDALAEIGGVTPTPEQADYLLGQADPVRRAEAVRRLSDDPGALELATRIVAGLREIAPEADLPKLPDAGARRRTGDAAVDHEPESPGRGLSKQQRLVMLGLLVTAVIVVGVVALTAGVLDAGDDSSGTQAKGAAEPEDAIKVKLEPQGSGDARGTAIFGLATADQLFLDLDVNGLEPAAPDQTYVIWLLLSPEQGYPVSPIEVSRGGSFSDRFPIPRFAVPIAGRSRFLDVSLADRARLQAQVQGFAKRLDQGAQADLPVLDYEGESVLRGDIPATGGPALLDEGGAGTGQVPAP